MLIVTSDPKLKEMLQEGRKQRSNAFFNLFSRVSFTARRKVVTASEKGATNAQGCPDKKLGLVLPAVSCKG